MYLSQHFTLQELTVSQVAVRDGLKNVPNAEQIESLRSLCVTILEPLRIRLNRPIVVSSGFRSVSVNRRVGGSSRSQHCRGEAADIIVPGVPVEDVIAVIRKLYLPVDQVIDEFGAWVHVSHKANAHNRVQYLKARREGGKTVFTQL